MKRTFKTVAMLALLTMTTHSCQKNELDSSNGPDRYQNTYLLEYAISGVSHRVLITDENVIDTFVDNLFAFAKEGKTICVGNIGNAVTKEKITFTTNSESEAKSWTKDKIKNGYRVEVTYDKTTGIYTCIAEK